jgi:hypothetical protein
MTFDIDQNRFVLNDIFIHLLLSEMIDENRIGIVMYDVHPDKGYQITVSSEIKANLYYWLLKWGSYAH